MEVGVVDQEAQGGRAVKFTLEGKSYEFDLDSLTMDEGEVIEDYARLEVRDFMDALKATKVRAIRALVFIAKRRAGEDVRWADLGSVDLMGLAKSMVDANSDAPAQDAPQLSTPDDIREAEGMARTDDTPAPVQKLKRATRKPAARKQVETVDVPALAEPEPASA